MRGALVKQMSTAPANTNTPTVAPSRGLLEQQAVEAFKALICGAHFRAFLGAMQGLVTGRPSPSELAVVDRVAANAAEPESEVMTADEVAAYLGIDRDTVYDYAARGEIPHQRLGKRLLFRRGALVQWLDSSLCKATSTRKG